MYLGLPVACTLNDLKPVIHKVGKVVPVIN